MKISPLYLPAVFLLTLGLTQQLSWAQSIREGNWSITVVLRKDGDAYGAGAQEIAQRASREDAAKLEALLGMGRVNEVDPNVFNDVQCLTLANPVPVVRGLAACELSHLISGNIVFVEGACPGEKSSGELTYGEDVFGGTITTVRSGEGREATTTTLDISATYLGPC